MALVFSYVRFSTRKQLEGDSLRRQVEMGAEWIARHKHTPASLTLHDLGVSAFRGKNKHSGAMGKFLEAVKAGRVKPGSILLIENLDRLSRQGVDEASDLFKGILKAGVSIAVLKPYEALYTKEAVNDFISLLIPLLYFHLAFIESKNKSDRLRKVWDHKREDAPSGKVFDKRRPGWVDWKDDGFALNEGAEAVRLIFRRTAEGIGQRQVVSELQRRFTPIGSSGHWNSAYVQKVLSDRSVLGERQPFTMNDEGERVPVGNPLPGYYPAVIEESLWHQAQASKKRRKKHKGPNGDFVNLFTGLVRNAHDGFPMHVQTTRIDRKDVQRRLVSYGHLSGVEGADSVSIPYPEFERAVLQFLNEIDPSALGDKASGSGLAEKQQELSGVDGRLSELREAMANPEMGNLPAILSAVASLEKRRAGLSAEIDRLKEETYTDKSLTNAKDVCQMLREAGPEGKHVLRLRLRSLIAELVEAVYLKPEKHYGRVYYLAQIYFRAGLVKQILAGPKVLIGSPDQQDGSAFAIDLRDKGAAKSKEVCAKVAKMIADPPEVDLPATVAETVGPASAHWLLIAKRGMAKASFRVVPSKIKRFVGFVGEGLPCRAIDGRTWREWITWLRGEIEAGRLERSTAKVNFNRAREFVRWLVSEGKTAEIDGLEDSGAAMMA